MTLKLSRCLFFDTVKDDDIVTDIMNLDISNMTPIDALNTLYKLQGKARTAGKTRRIICQ